MGKHPHVVAVPFPAQGHIKPLLKFAYQIASHGIKVTFVNTQSIHKKIVSSMSNNVKEHINIVFASIPDGLKAEDDQIDLPRSMQSVMPGYLKELIKKNNSLNEDEEITCIIADTSLGWILEVAEKMGLDQVAFSPASVGCCASVLHIPKLIEAGIVDIHGNIMKTDEIISLSPDIPTWKSTELTWSFPSDLDAEKIFFEVCLTAKQTAENVKWLICNTCYELETAACNLIPKIIPVGPLLSIDSPKNSPHRGNLWLEDTSCLTWLDQQSEGSVIYVSFGSIASTDHHQFRELALGLELSGRPFLWVVLSDLWNGLSADYPLEVIKKMASYGKIVPWAPQEKVLAHPSVGGFLTHCGWNSTLEGLSMGVPFLCWPFFGDQFHNQSYICEVWKTGVKVCPDENGVRSRHEIRTKIELLLSDDNFKANATRLKSLVRKSVSPGGSSSKNVESFIKFLKH